MSLDTDTNKETNRVMIDIESVLTVRREGAGLVSDSLRDGLLAKSGLGRGAGVAGHTRKSPRTIDKSSPSHVPNSTTSATGEVVA